VELTSSSTEETERIAARIAAVLRPGDVVTVSGELGSGKTTFVRGAARALGVAERVTSPTFTIGHRFSGDPDVSHLDLYRLHAVSPEEWGDIEPYFDDAVCFVEWPEAAEAWLPEARVAVRLQHDDSTHRLLTVVSHEKSLLEGVFPDADPGV
jgi:tRNA threonylcarbamoyladenosine biosynthesis protein TsaE